MALLYYFDYHYWINKEKRIQVDKIHQIRIQKAEEKKIKNSNSEIFKRNDKRFKR